MLTLLLVAVVVGYGLGALPFGYIVARAHGVNIFEVGSKSPGATNVKRVLGSKAGNLVFVLDALKGALAAALPLVWGYWKFEHSDRNVHGDGGGFLTMSYQMALASLVAAIVGHSFSVFTRFKGGKGVATTAGGFLVIMPLGTLISAVVWGLVFFTTRYVSLASILAAVVLPVTAWYSTKWPALVVVSAAMAAFVVIRHRANIQRLVNGTENKFVKKSKRDDEKSKSDGDPKP